MNEDDWLESAYEERYENDLEEWETEQVFRDREYELPTGDEDWDDPDVNDEDPLTADEYGLDDPCDCAYQLPCALHPEENQQDIMSSANPLGVDPEAAAEAITGGDGHGSADARQLVCIQPLADRSALSHKERIVILEADVRDAMAFARARLDREAMKYANQGFTWDLDDIVYDHGGRRIVTATLRIARNGA